MSNLCWGHVVIGPPGSGKTTYCQMMEKLLKEMGRNVIVVNMDPANDTKNDCAAVDISELITVKDVMDKMKLGPNGALLYCMEFLEKNISWLDEKLSNFQNHYFLFDCPGQVELYTHHSSIKIIIQHIAKVLGMHICIVQLLDSHYCSNAGKFIAAVLMALSTMLHLEMPQINVLSKIDIAEKHNDKLMFGIDFYTEVLNMNYLLDLLNADTVTGKYSKLNAAVISLIEGYGLVSFIPLNVKEKKSLLKLQREADRANGYVFGVGEERNIQALLACAAGVEYEDETILNFGEKNSEAGKQQTDLSERLLWN